MRGPSEHGGRVFAIPSPIPQNQRTLDIAFRSGNFCCQDTAADFQAGSRITQRCERRTGETVLARKLAHDLHQPPGKCACASLGIVGDGAARDLRLDIAFVESGFIAQRPGIPGGFLLHDGADQFGPECMRASRLLREGQKLRRW